MSDLRSLIESLHLEDIDVDKSESKSMSKFNMDGNSPKREHKKQKHPHVGPDRRGSWKRTEEYIQSKSLQMKELWSNPEFKEYMSERMTGISHVFVNKREPVDGYIWSEEARRRHSERVRDTIFINNGSVNRRLKKDQPIPEGWQRGRIRRHDSGC